jgi:UDP-N-acetyl-D-glucosamine/UDP-N-acetyl-D-galactosamine dehydrogenase
LNLTSCKVAVVGLGYVGLPLLIEFSKKYSSIGFDIDKKRIAELKEGFDKTNEISEKDLEASISNGLRVTNDEKYLSDFNVFIITVPTPLDKNKDPDLKYLSEASKTVSKYIKKDDIIIYESTVYPGCTEEFCVPILEGGTKLKYNKDFFCGYSPERINPGDKINTITNIKKVTSGSNLNTAKTVNQLYLSIISAGTYLANSIKVAEASKAIENAQRDLNISFMNELALMFDKMDIDTNEVIEAASTKWNFLKFKPGIVGGHCISVDPYYLVYKSKTLGYTPKVILSGREVNEKIGLFICNKVINLLKKNNVSIKGSKSLILGITFKENCPDIRNSKVIEIYNYLISKGVIVDLHDPHANRDEVKNKLGVNLLTTFEKYDSIILAVPHDHYKSLNFNNFKRNANSILYDVKGLLPKSDSNGRL